jgi:predicted 2-oxoglutarate/Fe(II)-dependent dioxygenase YbiX/peroxiredoxin
MTETPPPEMPAMPDLHPWFAPADHAPTIELRQTDGRPKPPSRMAGRIAVLHVAASSEGVEAALALNARAARLKALGADLYIVRAAAPVRNLAFTKKHALDLDVLSDEPGALAHNLNLKGPGTAIIGRDTRIVDVLPLVSESAAGTAVEAHFDRVEERVSHLSESGLRTMADRHAPVMVIPDVLSAEWCAYLRAVHDHEGNAPSGFMQQVKGETVEMQDPEVKVRRDHVIQPGSELDRAITQLFSRRLIPEIQKATHAKISRHEEFKIVRYDAAEGGHFRAHRDNTTQATRTRLFAVTLNLNTGGPDADYDGGQLVFPEYGALGYRPDPGSALVFSCTLLHEARPVIAGSRYVLLAFLH